MSSTHRAWRIAAVATAIVYGAMLLANAACISGLLWDYGWLVGVAWLAGAGLLIAMIAGVWTLFGQLRRVAAPTAATGLLLAIGFFPSWWLGNRLRFVGYRLAVQRAQPLVEALVRHCAERGRPPARLADLVPDFLPAMPKRLPPFDYRPDALNNVFGLSFTVPTNLSHGDTVVFYCGEPREALAARPNHLFDRWCFESR